MIEPLTSVELPGIPLFRRGKVRDTFDLGDQLLMVATDRLSAFDVVLPTPIPGKGIILTEISRFWFDLTSGLAPNHLVDTSFDRTPSLPPDVERRLVGRVTIAKKATRIDIECVVRGYLAGSAWVEYERTGKVANLGLPPGLAKGARLPAPMFTPAVKNDDGHDINISVSELVDLVGDGLARRLEEISRDIYSVASDFALSKGLILADTKFEFGFVGGELTLIDEVLTPDSSRYWAASEYRPGHEPKSFDKQFVRDWLIRSGWNMQAPGPELPRDVVEGTIERYLDACQRLTGERPAGF